MAWVIGEYGHDAGTGEGRTVEILWAQGNWPLGWSPGTFTVAVPGAFIEANPDFLDAGRAKSLICGDYGAQADQTVAFRHLWVISHEWGQRIRGNAVCLITLQDSRKFLQLRNPFGPWTANTPQGGERPSPVSQGSGVGTQRPFGANKRYAAAKVATVEEAMARMFDCMGVPPDKQAFGRAGTSVVGFLSSTSSILPTVANYQTGAPIGTFFDDMPEFVCPPTMTALEFGQKLEAMYDIIPALDPEDDRIGFVPKSGLPGGLDAIQDAIERLRYPGGTDHLDSHQVQAHGDAVVEDDLPDVLQVVGGQIALKGKRVGRLVIEDPDRPGRYLPLDQRRTLEALGIVMDGERARLQDGEDVIRLATHLFAKSAPWSEVPPRVMEYARQAFFLIQVAFPLEEVDAPITDAQGEPVTEVEEDYPLKVAGVVQPLKKLRRVAPIYRRFQDNEVSGVRYAQTGGTRHRMLPPDSAPESQPQRLLPAIRSPAGLQPAVVGGEEGDDASTTGIDGSWGVPKLWAVNMLRKLTHSQNVGHESEDWIDVNFVPGLVDVDDHPDLDQFAEVCELQTYDAAAGVFRSPIPLVGSNGITGPERRLVRVASDADRDATPSRERPAPRSLASAALDGARVEGKATQAEMLWELERETGGEVKAPWGSGFFLIEYANPLNSHNDSRDWTMCHSDPGSPDPWMEGSNVNEAFSPTSMGKLPELQGYQRGHPAKVHTLPMPNLRLLCEESRDDHHSFEREGGWRSGRLGGTMHFNDTFFRTAGRRSVGGKGAGVYVAASQRHYFDVLQTLNAVTRAMSSKIEEYRKFASAASSMNAALFGCHRQFFPGVADFLTMPVDGASISISGPAATATMRLSVNAKGFRAFLQSNQWRRQALAQALRANTGAIGAMFGGGGGGGGDAYTSAHDLQALSHGGGSDTGTAGRNEDHAPMHRPGVGNTPTCISDPRDPNSRLISGGLLNAGFDETGIYHPDEGTILSKREGPFLRIAVPGDWREMWLDEVETDDGRKYYFNLDGFTNLYGGDDKFHPDVGRTAGTFLQPSEPFPLVNARLIGAKDHERHGDMSIIAPLVWFKRRLPAGDRPGEGGRYLKREGLPVTDGGVPVLDDQGNPVTRTRTAREAANDRDEKKADLSPLELESFTGTTEEVPLVEGPGWVPCVIWFHEQFQMDPGTLGNPRHQHVHEGSHSWIFGGINEASVRDWLLFNPSAITLPSGGVGGKPDFCELLPMATGGLPRVDFAPFSYYFSILGLIVLLERMANEITNLSVLQENVRRAHAYSRADSLAIKKLWCLMVDSPEIQREHPDFHGKLEALGKICLPAICQEPCEGEQGAVETEEAETGLSPAFPGGPGTGAGAITGAPQFVPSAPSGSTVVGSGLTPSGLVIRYRTPSGGTVLVVSPPGTSPPTPGSVTP